MASILSTSVRALGRAARAGSAVRGSAGWSRLRPRSWSPGAGAAAQAPALFPGPPSAFDGQRRSIYMIPNLSKAKYQKAFKGRLRRIETRKNFVAFGGS